MVESGFGLEAHQNKAQQLRAVKTTVAFFMSRVARAARLHFWQAALVGIDLDSPPYRWPAQAWRMGLCWRWRQGTDPPGKKPKHRLRSGRG